MERYLLGTKPRKPEIFSELLAIFGGYVAEMLRRFLSALRGGKYQLAWLKCH
jgi:hypothetical protein